MARRRSNRRRSSRKTVTSSNINDYYSQPHTEYYGSPQDYTGDTYSRPTDYDRPDWIHRNARARYKRTKRYMDHQLRRERQTVSIHDPSYSRRVRKKNLNHIQRNGFRNPEVRQEKLYKRKLRSKPDECYRGKNARRSNYFKSLVMATVGVSNPVNKVRRIHRKFKCR